MKTRWVCVICGYVHQGEAPPARCPSCGASFTAFQKEGEGLAARLTGVTVVAPRPAGFRYVIIGNSAAGRSAARAIAHLHPEGHVTVISEEAVPLYSRPLLPDYIAGYDEDVFFASGRSYKTPGLELLLGETVTAVDPAAKTVTLASGRELTYGALLLATGSRPVQVPWPGSEAEGIAYFRTFADAKRIADLMGSAQRAVVVGGGLLGLEFVRAFHVAGLQITQLVRESFVGAPALDETAGEVLAKALADLGVEVILGDEVESFAAGPDGRVTAVQTKGGKTLPADVVGVAIGARPRIELAQAAGLQVDRGVLVDEFFRTSAPDIYAAGDTAQVRDYLTGESRVFTSWRNSDEQGEYAGIAMAGGERPYPGGVAANYQLAAGLPFCAVGVTNPPPDNDFEVEVAADVAALTFRKLIRKEGVVRGAVLIGDLSLAPELETQLRPAAPAAAEPVLTPAVQTERGDSDVKKMTEQFLKEAFAGESQAHMKYMNFAEKADEEGKANVARLFRAASYSEQVHASAHLDVLEGISDTAANLDSALGGEGFEIAEMYPAYMAVAETQGEEEAKTSFHQAYEAEKVHHEWYAKAKDAVAGGGDLEVDKIWVCSACGYTMMGEAPNRCPICTAPKKFFEEF